MKNSFLEELQTLAEGVEIRLDWENPQPYPDAQSTDSAMWAWEFLRRNRHYVRDFNTFVEKKDQDVHDKLAVAWGISRLADPCHTYSKLREEDVNIRSAFLFDGSEPYVVFPYYSKSEVIEKARPKGRRLPDPTELTMLLAPNQIAVILNLDGNIQLQIDSLLAQLKQPKTSGQSSRDTRCFVFEVDASGNQPSVDIRIEARCGRMLNNKNNPLNRGEHWKPETARELHRKVMEDIPLSDLPPIYVQEQLLATATAKHKVLIALWLTGRDIRQFFDSQSTYFHNRNPML